MEEKIKEVLKKISIYSSNKIEIRPYCRGRMHERNISESLLISTLFSNSLFYVKKQMKLFEGNMEKRYKLIFKISSKYSLIIIIAFYPKVLKVINVIKTSKKVEKEWQKKILK